MKFTLTFLALAGLATIAEAACDKFNACNGSGWRKVGKDWIFCETIRVCPNPDCDETEAMSETNKCMTHEMDWVIDCPRCREEANKSAPKVNPDEPNRHNKHMFFFANKEGGGTRWVGRKSWKTRVWHLTPASSKRHACPNAYLTYHKPKDYETLPTSQNYTNKDILGDAIKGHQIALDKDTQFEKVKGGDGYTEWTITNPDRTFNLRFYNKHTGEEVNGPTEDLIQTIRNHAQSHGIQDVKSALKEPAPIEAKTPVETDLDKKMKKKLKKVVPGQTDRRSRKKIAPQESPLEEALRIQREKTAAKAKAKEDAANKVRKARRRLLTLEKLARM